MNLQRFEKYFIPLLFATLFIVAFNWQFTISYAYIIENFKEDRLSTLYAHLFIYSFLVLSIFIFITTLFNHFILKSNFFIALTFSMFLIFYILSYNSMVDTVSYFIEYPLPAKAIMGIILFIVCTFASVIYPLFLTLFNKPIPLSHTFIFFSLTLIYSALFINTYCYPIYEILTKF